MYGVKPLGKICTENLFIFYMTEKTQIKNLW